MSIQYHAIKPTSQKASYTSGDNLQFELAHAGRNLVAGSIRISATLAVFSATGTAIKYDDNINLPRCGVHALFNNFICSYAGGERDNIYNYPRLANMYREATQSRNYLVTSTKKLAELCPPVSVANGPVGSEGYFTAAMLTPTDKQDYNPSFSMKPIISLNHCNENIPYAKTGLVRMYTRLALAKEAFFGADVSDDTLFKLTDVQLEYMTVPEVVSDRPIRSFSYSLYETSIGSSNANIQTRSVGVVDGISMSFLQVPANPTVADLTHSDPLPGLSRVEFSLDDSISNLIAFPLMNLNEIVMNYMASFKNTKGRGDMLMGNPLNNNDNIGIGLDLGGGRDITTFGCNIVSTIASAYNAYLFFRRVVLI